jgi:hypothetical protein
VEHLSRGVGPVDPGLTASTEGSPRPADGVWPRGSGSISAHDGVYGNLGWCRKRSCARSRSLHSEIRARGEKSVAEEKFSLRLNSRNVRSLRKELHGVWKDCRGERVARRKRLSLGIMEVGGRRTGIKASRPLDVDTSPLSSLSDCLKDSCVLVTKLSLLLLLYLLALVYSPARSLFSLDRLHSLARQRSTLAPVV